MSTRTTNLGARVSQRTVLADGDLSIGTWEVPSWSSLTVDGSGYFNARLDATAGSFYPRSVVTTTSLTSANIADGEMVFAINADSLTTLYIRSGVTTYQFASDATTVL